jgi:hypothetical protein
MTTPDLELRLAQLERRVRQLEQIVDTNARLPTELTARFDAHRQSHQANG